MESSFAASGTPEGVGQAVPTGPGGARGVAGVFERETSADGDAAGKLWAWR